MIVARHEVPGKRSPSRRIRSERALAIPELFLVESAFRLMFDMMDPFLNTLISSVFTFGTSSFQYCDHPIEVQHLKDQSVPYGSFGVAIPRHFVPGSP
jgi:hypothetical protein